ncbi:MAG: NnrU family protein [Devosiaceae bacterium]|nr:NnrU family protein [Devosiaceae bacterium]
MIVFTIGLLLFFVPHIVPLLVPGTKSALVEKIGEKRWKGVYSLLSLAGLVVIVLGWRQYRDVAPIVYDPPAWGRHGTMLLVWISLILFSVPRSKPGKIMVAVKHPMVVGVIYWSVGHLLANGDLASVLLFGSFLLFALISRIKENFAGDPNPKFRSYRSDIIAIGAGTTLYAVILLFGHVWLSGVALF